MAKKSKWNDKLIEELKILYKAKKYSTKQIGEKLGFSKNAIVGKIHRLELNKNINQSSETVPKLVSNCIGKYKLEEIEDNMCVWPFGEDQDITFCGQVVIPGKHYCKEHFEKAYLRFNRKPSKKSE